MAFITLVLIMFIVTAVICIEFNPPSCYGKSRGHTLRKGGIHQFHLGSTRDYVLRGRVYRNETTGSFMTCAGFCLQDDDCKSFIFCEDDKRCELNLVVHSKDLGGTQQSSECVYFDEECRKAVAFTTQPSIPAAFKFILSELTTPFRLRFTVRTRADAVLALARGRRYEDIFCYIIIGGWWNSKAIIGTGDVENPTEQAVFEEENQLNASEFRAFWIEYANSLFSVGKSAGGVESDPFMQWDVSNNYDPVPSQVYIALSSWHIVSGEWVFDQFCD